MLSSLRYNLIFRWTVVKSRQRTKMNLQHQSLSLRYLVAAGFVFLSLCSAPNHAAAQMDVFTFVQRYLADDDNEFDLKSELGIVDYQEEEIEKICEYQQQAQTEIQQRFRAGEFDAAELQKRKQQLSKDLNNRISKALLGDQVTRIRQIVAQQQMQRTQPEQLVRLLGLKGDQRKSVLKQLNEIKREHEAKRLKFEKEYRKKLLDLSAETQKKFTASLPPEYQKRLKAMTGEKFDFQRRPNQKEQDPEDELSEKAPQEKAPQSRQ